MDGQKTLFDISILVTCYNKKEFVAPCFEYINRLGELGAEIIIIDDGSTDGSSELLEEEIAKSAFQITIKHTENRGLAAARDLAIESSASIFIYCLDIDDEPNIPEIVRVLGEFRNSGCDMAIGGYWFSEQGFPGKSIISTQVFRVLETSNYRDELFDARGWWRFIYRRSLLMKDENRFGKTFSILKKHSFVLDDIYWMLHLSSQDLKILHAPDGTYLTNYFLPVLNGKERWNSYLKQVRLLPKANDAYIESLKFHSCIHNDDWMFKTLFINTWSHVPLLPIRLYFPVQIGFLKSSLKIAEHLNRSYILLSFFYFFLYPPRRLKRLLLGLKAH
jgi:glycosyltransferase involved in cell wall biosynthesis